MPRIPTYDEFQVAPTAGPGARVEGGMSPEMASLPGRQMQNQGAEMMSAGSDFAKVALDMQNDANTTRVNDAMNDLVKARIDAQAEALSLKGKNALERPDGKSLVDEYSEKLGKVQQDINQRLGNQAQRLQFNAQAGHVINQLRGQLTTHMVEQQRVFSDQTDKSAIELAQNQAMLLWGDQEMRNQSTSVITDRVEQMAKRNGWDDATKQAALIEGMSPMHAGIIKAMIADGHAVEAQDYYKNNSAQMSIQARATMGEAVKNAADYQVAEGKVDEVWAQFGPKGANDAVKLYDMEQALREGNKDNPDVLAKSIASLRQRSQAFNAQQAETNAANINGVYGLIDKGTPLSRVQSSDAWLALPEAKRHDILKSLEAEAHAREQRALTSENRELLRMQREEKLNFLRNGDKFLTASDPDVLSKMTRAQVEAMRTDFGMEPTQHLLAKWDALQKPGKVAEARIDTQDFNTVAEQLGLRPYDPKKSEKERSALGNLQYRVEQLIDQEQTKRKAPMTREEKMGLMRTEMARTVEVEEWGRNPQVPVIQLTGDQAAKVVVPAADRTKIAAKMAQKFQETGGDARFAPTEANLRYWYLSSKSPAASFIPDKK